MKKTTNFDNNIQSIRVNKSIRAIFIKLKDYFKQTTLILTKYYFQKKEPYGKKVHSMELHLNILLLMKIVIILALYA